MAKIEVVLVKPISGLGKESDQVQVAAGYARNYLIPEGFAIPVTEANKRQLAVLKMRQIARESRELNAANELVASLSKLLLTLKVRTGENGRLFGSVTAANISTELKQQFDVDVARRKIHLENPIKKLGEYVVELRLHGEITAELRVKVESINQAAVGEAANTAEASIKAKPA
ncbi:MAG: 50S ribosomal protein L9 [Verrucomicrobia subdivision 3 bacterium]|nr:50S ribosomal protein L9 [Limisphaerales bacterium]MCS1412976.1 50S ribosomal protein L9 [Limisphaerales bacterium]